MYDSQRIGKTVQSPDCKAHKIQCQCVHKPLPMAYAFIRCWYVSSVGFMLQSIFQLFIFALTLHHAKHYKGSPTQTPTSSIPLPAWPTPSAPGVVRDFTTLLTYCPPSTNPDPVLNQLQETPNDHFFASMSTGPFFYSLEDAGFQFSATISSVNLTSY